MFKCLACGCDKFVRSELKPDYYNREISLYVCCECGFIMPFAEKEIVKMKDAIKTFEETEEDIKHEKIRLGELLAATQSALEKFNLELAKVKNKEKQIEGIIADENQTVKSVKDAKAELEVCRKEIAATVVKVKEADEEIELCKSNVAELDVILIEAKNKINADNFADNFLSIESKFQNIKSKMKSAYNAIQIAIKERIELDFHDDDWGWDDDD